MLPLALILLAIAIGVGLWVVLSSADEKATVRASLRQLEGYEVVDNVRDQELLKPMRERTVAPVVGGLVDLGKRFTPDGYTDKVRSRMVASGNNSSDAVDRFVAIKVIGFALTPLSVFLVFGFLGMSGMMGLVVSGLLAAVLIFGPDAVLNRRVEERQRQIRTKLPDVLDLLVISVEAGLGFEQALDRTVASVPGPLTQEFARMLGEVRAGASRADAMRAMEKRTDVPELRSFVLAILQADTFGVSIGRVLRAQADEMRIKRRQLAQEKAQKAPVKMMIPMVFCVFPALFVVVIGPAIISITNSF
jgi:tight adherence protein C